MSQIRKRSLKGATWIYLGFLIGAVNTYLFTRKNSFGTDQYGLTRSLLDISMLLCAFATFGVTNFLIKFFPYYNDNLEPRKNDILSFALIIALAGFVLTAGSLYFLQPVIIRKFNANSPLLVEYFYYVIPFTFFVLLYNIFEAYAYGFNKGVFTSLLKETILRFYTTLIILLKVFDFINFQQFILLFSIQYAVIVLVLTIHLKRENKLWLCFRFSKVTKKFRQKILILLSFTFIVIVVSVLRQSIDALVLAAKQDLNKVGIFGFSSYLVSVMQAPYRSLLAVTIPILSRAWKDKNMREINKIYHRSSINLFSFALFIFIAIWLNFDQAILTLKLNPEYLEGKWVFFLLGLVSIVEMGTGVNGQIIGTSIYWRFELWTSLLLTLMIIPLSYFFTIRYGIYGPALANVISFTIYNFMRFWFLWKKIHMQPFSRKTLEVIIIAVTAYCTCYFAFMSTEGLIGLFLRTVVFVVIYCLGIYYRNVSPDINPVINNLMRRIRLKT